MTPLKIHKKYLADVEQYTKFGYGGKINPYAVRYIFSFPQDSEYKDYALLVDTEDFKYEDRALIKDSVGKSYELKGSYYTLTVKEDATFTISRYFNREDGKKYKRHTLDATQLNAIFNHGKSISELPFVVASLKEYLDNGTRDAGRVIKESITLARSDGTWIYVNEERRRINSKGVTILGKISPESKNVVAELIASFYKSQDEIYSNAMRLSNDNYELNVIMDHSRFLSSEETSKAICKLCIEQRTKNLQAAEKEKASLEDLKESFKRELSGYYISEDPASRREESTKLNNKPLSKKL